MPSIDPYSGFALSPEGPVSNVLQITPSDTEDLPVIPLRVFFAHPGTYRVTFLNGEEFDLRTNMHFSWQDIRVKRIHQTGTIITPPDATPEIFIFW